MGKCLFLIKMTKLEKLINEVGKDIFFNDYVYENLKCFDSSNNKIEICDALFEYCDNYVVIQAKERGSYTDDINKENKWLDNVVEKATKQIIKSIELIKKDESIVINDLYHQSVILNSKNNLFPIIIFDNPLIKEYKRVVCVENLLINVFSFDDFSNAVKATIHPFRFFNYLENRATFFFSNDSCSFPKLFIGEDENSITMSSIKTEIDFSSSFNANLFNKIEPINKLMNIIKKFKSKMLKNDPNYKTILKLLQYIKPEQADEFVSRFETTMSEALNKKETMNKALIEVINNKKTAIVFVSSGAKKFEASYVEQLLYKAKDNMKVDNVLLLLFSYYTDKDFDLDWIYFEQNDNTPS